MLELLMAQLAPYLPYLIGFAVKAILDYLGIKLPMLPAAPDGKPADGKPTPVLDTLRLLLKARAQPEALTDRERAEVAVLWDATPDERPR